MLKMDTIEKLTELRLNYSCFDDEEERGYYDALSEGIDAVKTRLTPEEKKFLEIRLKTIKKSRLAWIEGRHDDCGPYIPRDTSNEARERWAEDAAICDSILRKFGYTPTKKLYYEFEVPEDIDAFELSQAMVKILELSKGSVRRIPNDQLHLQPDEA